MTTITDNFPAERVLLHDVSWDTYMRLMEDQGSRSSPRFTFDNGELEVMTPLAIHERINRGAQVLVDCVAVEFVIEIDSLGSTTFSRRDLTRGFEPDSCFYVQNESAVRGKARIDLSVDPPPDVVLEIEITRGPLPKLPIFEQFGVPEVWRYDGSSVRILLLDAAGYHQVERSRALPMITADALTRAIDVISAQTRTEWLRQARQWAKSLRVGS